MKKQTLLILTLLLTTTTAHAQTTYTPQTLIINIYPDGSTNIDYTIKTDPTKPRTNITLFGDNYQNLIVTDQNGLSLNWKTIPYGIQTDTLGSHTITITYETYSLTNKNANQWTITLTTPINTIYNLPENAILTGLDPTPLSITTNQDQATITQPNGTNRISYILGTTGTKERAIVLINKAENTIQEAKTKGFKVDEPETQVNEAKNAYNDGDYSRSEQLSTNAITQTQEITQLATQAQTAIESAETLLSQASETIDTQTVTRVQEQLDKANEAFNVGEYETASVFAEDAFQLAASAPKTTGNNQTITIGAFILAGIIIIWLAKKRTRPAKPTELKQRAEIDLDKLFKDNPHLRTDEKAVLRYIHESAGVFVSEIRERFDIPKSSTWRMINRLEEGGLIKTEMVGRESYVDIKTN